LTRALWYLVNHIIFKSNFFNLNGVKIFLLRAFGAQVGKGAVIKPNVNIKYPWNLRLGDNVWIGECCWIDNLGFVDIGSNSNLSQGAMILTGSHDLKKESFDLIVRNVFIGERCWLTSKSIVSPGARLFDGTIVSPGSVVYGETKSNSIYRGNPATSYKDLH